MSEKINWKDASLSELINQLLYTSGKMHEAIGWKEAGTYIRELAGKKFSDGKDDEARSLRDFGTFLLVEGKVRFEKSETERKNTDTDVWKELTRRFPGESI